MGVYCDIVIIKPREGIHRPGKPVNGVIKYAIDKPTEYQDITLSLIGKGKCHWLADDSDSTAYSGTENIIDQHINILRQPGKPEKIPVGTYEYPFQFVLPQNIPPSFENKTCTVCYYLKVKFAKTSLFSIIRKFKTELTVFSNVTSTSIQGPVIFGLEKSVFKPLAENSRIQIKAEIEKSIFAPGENISLSVITINDSDVTGWSVKTTLQSETTYTSNCKASKTETKTIKESSTEIEGSTKSVIHMTRRVPILPELYSIQNSKVISRTYNVIVKLRMPAPHTNAQVAMPIVIGECASDEELMLPKEPPVYWEHPCQVKEIPSKNQKL